MFAGKVSKCIPVLSYPLRSVHSPLFVQGTPRDTQPYREIQYTAHPSLALPSSIMNFPSAEELFASGGLVIQAAAVAGANELSETNQSKARGRFAQPRKHHSIYEVYNWMGAPTF